MSMPHFLNNLSFAFSNMDEYNFFQEEDDYSNLDLVEVFCEEEGFQDNLDAETLKLLKNFK